MYLIFIFKQMREFPVTLWNALFCRIGGGCDTRTQRNSDQAKSTMNTPGRRVPLVVCKVVQAGVGKLRAAATMGALTMLLVSTAHAGVALLLEEPFGRFGAMNPTGHAAVYLSHICTDAPTHLRMCRAGEYGSVVSRYHKINGYDWIAMPLIPYLYATESPAEIPDSVDAKQVAELRDAYRRTHLKKLAPDTADGTMPGGEWIQLVGSSYDRTIYGFEVATTAEQDLRFVALFNDRKDVSHFNLFFRNCADFSREVLNTYIPGVVHRNFVSDVGLTTPKQVARSLAKYGEAHPDVPMATFVIPQVEGSVKRSHPVNGVMESLVKSKKYLIPLAVLTPTVMGTVAVVYLVDGRFKMPKNAPVFDLAETMVKPEEIEPAPLQANPADASYTLSASDDGTAEPPRHEGAGGSRTAVLLR